MGEQISKDKLELLIDEIKGLENSVLLELTESKIKSMQDVSANLPVYDTETMVQREYVRGMVEGLRWFTVGVNKYIEDSDALLQKRKK